MSRDPQPKVSAHVAVEITRFLNADNPGWVECRLVDLSGREHLFHEKIPVVTTDDLWSDTHYPQPGVIAAIAVRRSTQPSGQECLTVDTAEPWDIESTTGETIFELGSHQLVPIDSD